MEKNLKQIREEVRKKLAKEYEQKIKSITGTCNYYNELRLEFFKKYNCAVNEVKSLKEQINELNEKICMYEEWVERMQDFCNLPEEERLNAVRKYNVNKQTEMKLSKIFDSYLNLFNL